MNRLTLCAGLLIAAVLTGCAATSVTVRLVGIAPLNEAQAGESRPVEVRVFQLRDETRFQQANIDLLWSNPEEALGDSLIDVRMGVNIFPEQADQNPVGRRVVIEPLSQETRYIGVFALYERSEEGSRQVLVLPVEQAGNVRLRLTGYTIEVMESGQ
jgi:type VI secretion system protein VasD